MNDLERDNFDVPEDSSEKKEIIEDMQKALDIAGDVKEKSQETIQEGRNEIENIEKESGLSPEQIEEARADFKLDQQIENNENSIKELSQKTLESIKSLVDILGDNVSSDEVDKIMKEHGVNSEVAGFGAFYDTFEIEGTDEVLKVMKLNYLFNQEQAIRMLARHAHEAERFKDYFSEEFIPPATFIYPEKMKSVFEDEL